MTDVPPGRPRETRRALLRVYSRRLAAQSPTTTARSLLRPGVLRRHLRRLVSGRADPASNAYLPAHSRSLEIDFCAALLELPPEEIDGLYREVEESALTRALRGRYLAVRPTAPPLELGRFRIWYAIVRGLRPEAVLETGVHDGLSSAVMLLALERNGEGRLVSVDLPSTDLPTGVEGPGWLVPAELRHRWELRIGDARALLPGIAAELSRIDLFSHDSDHSQEHQRFEYETVRPFLGPGALVLSDQDYPHERALPELAASVGGVHRRVRTIGGEPGLFAGAVRLPLER